MPERLRAAGILAIVLALIAYAYAPLLAAGFLGEDLAVVTALDSVDPAAGPGGWYSVAGTEARPGAVLLLLASRLAWTADGLWVGSEALVLRLEHLALLCLAAWGMVGALRRILEPWAGPDVARAAGHAGAAFLLVHPLAVSAVARLSVRGDLAAVALGAWSVRAFLRGRQDRVRRAVSLSLVLAALAGMCSPLALYLPLLMAAVAHALLRAPRRAVAVELPQVSALFGACVADQRAAEPAVVAALDHAEALVADRALRPVRLVHRARDSQAAVGLRRLPRRRTRRLLRRQQIPEPGRLLGRASWAADDEGLSSADDGDPVGESGLLVGKVLELCRGGLQRDERGRGPRLRQGDGVGGAGEPPGGERWSPHVSRRQMASACLLPLPPLPP